MLPVAISLENYKAFSGREEIEIRPLTLLVGKNSSGKSVIARAPLLLARALTLQAEAPLELEFQEVDFGASFLDLVHNRNPHGAVQIGARFRDGDGSAAFRAKVQHFNEYRLQLVTEFQLNHSSFDNVKFIWVGRDPVSEGDLYREVHSGTDVQIQFRGLFPQNVNLPGEPAGMLDGPLRSAQQSFSQAMANPTYLGPFREAPRRAYRFPGGIPENLGSRGSRAPELLGADWVRYKGALVEAVGTWFQNHMGGWRLVVTESGDMFSLVLQDPADPSVRINIVDAGVGISQVLPMVVQRLLSQVGRSTPSIEIVEQPELHLHPGAHPALAELYIAAAEHEPTRFILETHSENLLLRIRRAVAEGRLNSEKVIIYWISDDSSGSRRAHPIHISPDGSVDMWPSGVFSEDFEEVRAIQNAARGRHS